jgi:hypothetical protein
MYMMSQDIMFDVVFVEHIYVLTMHYQCHHWDRCPSAASADNRIDQGHPS